MNYDEFKDELLEEFSEYVNDFWINKGSKDITKYINFKKKEIIGAFESNLNQLFWYGMDKAQVKQEELINLTQKRLEQKLDIELDAMEERMRVKIASFPLLLKAEIEHQATKITERIEEGLVTMLIGRLNRLEKEVYGVPSHTELKALHLIEELRDKMPWKTHNTGGG